MKDDILKLREEGKTYDEICDILGCAKSTVSYHCGAGQKQKSLSRSRKNRLKQHPFCKKVEQFSQKKTYPTKKDQTTTFSHRMKLKIEGFHRMPKSRTYTKPTFTFQDVIDKFGENPVCYLTGASIDIEDTRSYHFDHIVPRSRGGQSTIDNLGIATKEANTAKSNMSHDEFLKLCLSVVMHNNLLG